MKKVLCVGYRKWALNIYSKIAKNIYAIYPKYSNEYLDTNTPTVPTIS